MNLIVVVAVGSAIYVLVVYVLMYAANRAIHRKVAVWIGGLATAYVLYSVINTMVVCGSEPQYIPPAPGESGDGAMIHACDGPGGIIDYAHAYLFGPITIGLCAWLTWRFWNTDTSNA